MLQLIVLALVAGQAETVEPAVAPSDVAPVIVQSPGPEASALALELARSGTLASLLPVIAAKETGELIAAHPELTPAEQGRLRAVAQATLDVGAARLFAATAREYARRLTLADLRQQVAVARLASSQRLRAAQPAAIAAAIAAQGADEGDGAGFDFKRDTLTAFCRETGRACEKAK